MPLAKQQSRARSYNRVCSKRDEIADDLSHPHRVEEPQMETQCAEVVTPTDTCQEAFRNVAVVYIFVSPLSTSL
jgi:hypothetical protein